MKRKLFFILFIISCWTDKLDSQSAITYAGSAWQTSNGGIVSNSTGINVIYNNPASICKIDSKWGFDVGVERRFNLDELSTYSGGVFYKMKTSAFSLNLVRFGYEDFTEQKLSFSYSRSILNNFDIGSSFVLLQYFANEYGSKYLLSFDIGLNADINDKLSIGAVLNNPASTRLDARRDIPVRLAIGTIYKPSKKVSWLFEFEKILNTELSIKSAIIYKPTTDISLRIGGDFNRNIVGVGLFYNLNGMHVLGSYSYHSILGSYPSLSLGYVKD